MTYMLLDELHVKYTNFQVIICIGKYGSNVMSNYQICAFFRCEEEKGPEQREQGAICTETEPEAEE